MIRLALVCLLVTVLAKPHLAPVNKQASLTVEADTTVKQDTHDEPKSKEVAAVKPVAPKPKAKVQKAKPKQPERPAAVKTAQVHPIGCENYKDLVAQYDWDVSTAMSVIHAESTCNPSALNNNPNTGDYSVGLFQINLHGANALYRPSEAELKVPATNIAWAYKLYSGNGKSFVGQWGVCRAMVACY